MKKVFPIEALKKIVGRCVRFSNPRGLIQEYGYFYFDGDSLKATDGFVGIIHISPVTFETMVAVPSELFSRPIQTLSQDVELEVSDKNIVVRSGDFKAKFPVIGLDSKKVEINPPDFSMLSKLPSKFMDSLKQVLFSVSKDETKIGMRGILFKDKKFYSTDNYRISRAKFLGDFKEGFFIPDRLLSLVLSEEDPIEYCLEGNKLWLFYEDFLVFGILPSVPFPECDSLFSTPPAAKVYFTSSKVLECLDRLSVFVSNFPYRMDVLVYSNSIFFIVHSGGTIEAVEAIECKSEITGVFAANINYFREAAEKSEWFTFNKNIICFYSKAGLESILLQLEAKDLPDLGEFKDKHATGILEGSGSRVPIRAEETKEESSAGPASVTTEGAFSRTRQSKN